MAVTYTNEINTEGLRKSSALIGGSDDVLLHIPYSLVATDGDFKAQDARVVTYAPAELSAPFIPYVDLVQSDFDTMIAEFEALHVVDAATGATGLDVMKVSLAEQVAEAMAPVMIPAEEAAAMAPVMIPAEEAAA
jgi:hypothetical protein